MGQLPRETGLVSGFCSSHQMFAYGFLQIPNHSGHPCFGYRIPVNHGSFGTCGNVSTHPLDLLHARQEGRKRLAPLSPHTTRHTYSVPRRFLLTFWTLRSRYTLSPIAKTIQLLRVISKWFCRPVLQQVLYFVFLLFLLL